ncbi:hypothetical protein FIBSPDRAFT_305645 [Athelia psychrophila]|uniref:Uncharacterized protein n=1 Tax=Athelia psychrophila TaxID=1759441 RepID=A0A166W515_9AGAM|nr:hypothetical protein FIBSPDRAFT_305645 [Fibularhizoctonia sp. CBS 109695]
MNGAWLVAFTVAAALYGIISAQTLYLRRDCRDCLTLKAMIIAIWGLESIHVFFCACTTWDLAAANYAHKRYQWSVLVTLFSRAGYKTFMDCNAAAYTHADLCMRTVRGVLYLDRIWKPFKAPVVCRVLRRGIDEAS